MFSIVSASAPLDSATQKAARTPASRILLFMKGCPWFMMLQTILMPSGAGFRTPRRDLAPAPPAHGYRSPDSGCAAAAGPDFAGGFVPHIRCGTARAAAVPARRDPQSRSSRREDKVAEPESRPRRA